MKIKKFNKFQKAIQDRAGLVPYIIDEDGEIEMMFYIPSDVAYGGYKFQIAKGRVDYGESPQEAAIREAEEEIGLDRDNIKNIMLVSEKKLTGSEGYEYILHLYAVEVKNKKDFNQFEHETKETGWLTIGEYTRYGRGSQLKLVNKVYDRIENTLKK
jgi:8-oxo-dGTP pyrophosphatase MutT (NUDIX family)